MSNPLQSIQSDSQPAMYAFESTDASRTSPAPSLYLPPSRASSIESWSSSVSERTINHHNESHSLSKSHQATIEAYRKVKLALFSKVQHAGRPES
ncbi:hypothetical protein BU24DRAFT_18094 [Aaosphaeria arxii CBS 175.79]|uniref:Uncharacterized protein n=1 Tax=Aaosphaeria arxii CBS 175.79 TaxID=1450172 RepID=A0A6A5Y6X1_9PLEO|nr:uncharacterized protein BU24DRAFT_18094 [Aaosphaeria arxii CBS 175.79]KAF2021278.1 hypothetical protein BU24DRAFT_18094 [Aaosphaeria arxii CBS 175.79]